MRKIIKKLILKKYDINTDTFEYIDVINDSNDYQPNRGLATYADCDIGVEDNYYITLHELEFEKEKEQ